MSGQAKKPDTGGEKNFKFFGSLFIGSLFKVSAQVGNKWFGVGP